VANNQLSWWRQTLLPSLGLFTSVGTLLCCALPALLVTLGMGAALAGLIGTMPWITVVSDYKEAVFAVAGLLIVIAVFLQWRARHAPCPADPAQARACNRLRRAGWVISGTAMFVYLTGFFFAFVAVPLFWS